MTIVSRDNTEHYKWGADCDGWHFVKSDKLSVIQERVPPGAGEARHYHENAEQFFFVLSGVATIDVANETHVVTSQQGISVSAGVVHELRNENEQDLYFLVISSPLSHGDRKNC